MNYFFITTLIFLILFIITLIYLIFFIRKSKIHIINLKKENDNLKSAVQELESARREYQKLLDIIIDNLQQGVVILDKNLKTVKINNSISNLFYIDRTKLIGEMTIFIFNNRNLEELIEETLQANKPLRKEIIFYRDEEISLSVDAIPINLYSYNIMLLFNNTTQEVEFARLRSQFVANVSHEMRTPLTSIKGYIETLLEDSKGTEELTERYLTRAMEEVERLNMLIEDVLNLSKIEYRRNVLLKKEYNIIEIIKESIDSLSFLAEKNKSKIYFNSNQEPVYLHTEEELFIQLVRNLVENAIFHGGDDIMITINVEEKHGGLTVSFEDNGKGIDSSDLPYIFQRFYRGKNKYPGLRTGSGLGLSIVKHIMELHDGKVEV